MACGAVSIATSLVVSGIAHTHASIEGDPLAWLLLMILAFVQLMAVIGTIALIEEGWPGRGMQVFAMGMIALGVTITYVTSYQISDTFLGFATWGLAGMHIGWLCECLTGALGTLAGYLNKQALANRRAS